MYKMSIIVKNRIEGIHYYKQAPDEVSFLRHPHRHMFHTETEIEVFHDDRDLEFLMVQRTIDEILNYLELSFVSTSCEQLAKSVIEGLVEVYGQRKITCTVYEDGENGARVSYWAEEGESL